MACTARHPEHERFVRDAFEEHRRMLHGRLLAFTRDEAAADDLLQDAFARLMGQVCDEQAPDNVAGWLWRAAMNLALSRVRHRDVERRHAPALARDDVVESPERAIEAAETTRQLGTALSTLPAPDRALILLAAAGATGAELAQCSGRTEPAARTALCRARGRLRLLMAAV